MLSSFTGVLGTVVNLGCRGRVDCITATGAGHRLCKGTCKRVIASSILVNLVQGVWVSM